MHVPIQVLLQPWPKADGAPLLQTVLHVLKSVATGSNSQTGSFVPGPGAAGEDAADGDPECQVAVDNIGEHLLTTSPSQSPLSSPARNTSSYSAGELNQRQRLSSSRNNAEQSDANFSAVRLAARMVIFAN